MMDATPRVGVGAQPRIAAWVRPLAGLLLLLLALQFVIGMVVNLWITLPAAHPGHGAANYFLGVLQGVAWAIAAGAGWLQLHALLGLLLFFGAILLLVAAIVRREALWIWVASLGLAGIMAAGFNGASFLNYGHDFSSMLMSGGFVLALGAYMSGVYYTRPDAR